MSMNVSQNPAVGGRGMYPPPPSRGPSRSLENLSTGFRIDSGAAGTAEPAGQGARARTVNLESAVRNAAQSPIVQSVSQNGYGERNADLVRQQASGNTPSPATGGTGGIGGNGKLDAYA